jgi:hypothetical protein
VREGAHKIAIIAGVALNIALGYILVAFSSKDFATGYSGFDVQFSLVKAWGNSRLPFVIVNQGGRKGLPLSSAL